MSNSGSWHIRHSKIKCIIQKQHLRGGITISKLLNLRTILITWLLWALIMTGYQVYVKARYDVQRPDDSLNWTGGETRANSQNGKPYLLEPFLNDHVSWDSEYYLSIAVGGYNDPNMRAIAPNFTWSLPQVSLQKDRPEWISMNYAFFPFYPYATKLLAFPLGLLGMNPIATASLAAVLVSLLGTLLAMLALYDMARDDLGEEGGRRAAFYLIIFPAAMFLAQVYTEGLFLGLTFGSIALARRKKWLWAALLAVGATWTRAGGLFLVLPLAWYWWKDGSFKTLLGKFSWRELGKLVLVITPILAYLAWNAVLGKPFHLVEDRFFSRGLLLIQPSLAAWGDAWKSMFSGNSQATAYHLVEFGSIAFALLACAIMAKREPILVLYSLAVIAFSLTSGVAQGMHRYVMAAPVLFLLPARWGKSEAFDRIWTLGCILLMGIFAAMFSFDFWAG